MFGYENSDFGLIKVVQDGREWEKVGLPSGFSRQKSMSGSCSTAGGNHTSL